MSSPVKIRAAIRTGLAVLVAFTAFAALTGCNPVYTRQQEEVREQMNHDRRVYGRSNLPMQFDAAVKAQAWAEKLARDGRLSHSNLPSGINVRWCALGENVGMGPNSIVVQAAYMKSPAHRTNILSTKWNGVGIGYARRNNTTYTVQVFIKTC
ncbi:MAG: CAP domain-containing protein [Acidimicrobiales bacterium]|nr:CAP domain-containing protein [Acidimicrobiales bacterium]